MRYTFCMDEERFLTAPEVAKLLGVSSASINIWLKLGNFPNAYRINPTRPKSAWRIPRSDVESFIMERRKQRGYQRPVDLSGIDQ